MMRRTRKKIVAVPTQTAVIEEAALIAGNELSNQTIPQQGA